MHITLGLNSLRCSDWNRNYQLEKREWISNAWEWEKTVTVMVMGGTRYSNSNVGVAHLHLKGRSVGLTSAIVGMHSLVQHRSSSCSQWRVDISHDLKNNSSPYNWVCTESFAHVRCLVCVTDDSYQSYRKWRLVTIMLLPNNIIGCANFWE